MLVGMGEPVGDEVAMAGAKAYHGEFKRGLELGFGHDQYHGEFGV